MEWLIGMLIFVYLCGVLAILIWLRQPGLSWPRKTFGALSWPLVMILGLVLVFSGRGQIPE